jgi:hypothetical protein
MPAQRHAIAAAFRDRRGVLRLGMAIALCSLAGHVAATGPAHVELVYVREAGCPWCRAFDERIGPVYPRTEEGQRAPLRDIDRGDAALGAYQLKTPVIWSPTFVLVVDRVEVGRIEGYPGEEFFWARLGKLLARLPPAP